MLISMNMWIIGPMAKAIFSAIVGTWKSVAIVSSVTHGFFVCQCSDSWVFVHSEKNAHLRNCRLSGYLRKPSLCELKTGTHQN